MFVEDIVAYLEIAEELEKKAEDIRKMVSKQCSHTYKNGVTAVIREYDDVGDIIDICDCCKSRVFAARKEQ